MFGIGPAEMIVIAVVILVFVGPQRLPELTRQVGKLFVKARQVSTEVRETIDQSVRTAERELAVEEHKKALKDALKMPVDSARSADNKTTPREKLAHGEKELDGQEQPRSLDDEAKGPGVVTSIRMDRSRPAVPDWESSGDPDLPPLATNGGSKTAKGHEEGQQNVPIG